MTELHKTPEEVDEMLWPEVTELFDYWNVCPPPGLAFKILLSGLGIKFPEVGKTPAGKLTPADEKAAAVGQVKTFDQLPLAVQARLKQLQQESEENNHGS